MSREFITDSGWYFISVALSASVYLIAIPIITRLVSVDSYGQFLLVVTSVGFLSTLAVGWISPSVIRFAPAYKSPEERRRFFSLVLKLTFLSIGGIGLVAGTIVILMPSSVSLGKETLVLLSGFIVIAESCSIILLSFLRANRQLRWYSFFAIWCNTGKLVLGVLMVIVLDLGMSGLLWGWLTVLITSLPVMGAVALKGTFTIEGLNLYPRSMLLEIVRYGIPVMMMTFLVWVLSASDRYMLGLLRGVEEVGIYSASYDLSEKSLFQIISIFKLAGVPLMFNIWEHEGEVKSRKLIQQMTSYYLLVGLPVTVLLSVLAKPIVEILLPAVYQQAYRVIPIVALGTFLWGLMHIVAYPLGLHKRPELNLMCLFSAGVLNVGLNWIFIPLYGYMAAAWSTLASYALALISISWIARRFFVWRFPFQTLGRVSAAIVIMGIVCHVLATQLSWPMGFNIIIAIVGGFFVYLLVLIIITDRSDNLLAFFRFFKAYALRRLW